MYVSALYMQQEKGAPPQCVDTLALTVETDAAGDSRFSGARQLSLIGREALLQVEQIHRRGLCMDRFFANIVIDGLKPMQVGGRLQIGGAMLRITQTGKRCFAECALAQEGFATVCPLQACAFAQVEQDGQVKVNCPVILCAG